MQIPTRTAAPRRAALIVSVLSAALITALTPAAQAQNQFFDNDGDVIGVVNGLALVGFNTTNAITVFANAGTSSVTIQTYNSSTLDMSGGNVSVALNAFDNSRINLSGGTVLGGLYDVSANVVTVSGGTVGGLLLATGGGVVNVTGGTLGALYLDSNPLNVAHFSGGTVLGDLYANAGVINWSGGALGGNLYGSGGLGGIAFGPGLFRIFGSNLSDAFVSATYDAPNNDYISVYSLSGFLADGTDITGKTLTYRGLGAAPVQFINVSDVPEPGIVAFCVMAAGSVLGLVVRKRRK